MPAAGLFLVSSRTQLAMADLKAQHSLEYRPESVLGFRFSEYRHRPSMGDDILFKLSVVLSKQLLTACHRLDQGQVLTRNVEVCKSDPAKHGHTYARSTINNQHSRQKKQHEVSV